MCSGTAKNYAKNPAGLVNEIGTGAGIRPLIAIQQRAEQASRVAKPLAQPLTSCCGFCYDAALSFSIASRCFMHMYFLPPYWVPAT